MFKKFTILFNILIILYNIYLKISANCPDPAKRLSALSGGVNHILSIEEGRKRYLDAIAPLNRAAALSIHLEGTRHLRDDNGYFQSF